MNAITMIFFTDVDPGLNYINHTNKKCSYYTINEFNNDYFNYNTHKNNLFFIQILEAVHITKLMISNVIYRP